ncbi:MAG TPA: radical SAM protein [Candidatus Binataceae bacterium]
MNDTRPRSRDAHLIAAEGAYQLFLPNGSRLYDIDGDLADTLDKALNATGTSDIRDLLTSLGLDGPAEIDAEPPAGMMVRALSLSVAQTCNLGCSYCYAQGGDFGGPSKSMPVATALGAVDLLLRETRSGERANLAFLGGEPLVARDTIRAATCYAAALAAQRNIGLTYSITTNGTLLTTDDAGFFEDHGFAVTISLDGTGAEHDRLRPYKNGRGSFDRVIANVRPLLARQKRMQVSARVTVTPNNLDLRSTLEHFIGLGFHNVGFSPMLSSPGGKHEMTSVDLDVMLASMIACGQEFERRALAGQPYPFANMINALREIHRGTQRPYPCGAGAGYMGVSADGALSACHRFVGDEAGAMGDLVHGVDRMKQANWLTDRHVSQQEPCNSCWARYLCGGGCHHETLSRGRPACDFIRGWLHYCLAAYGRLSQQAPSLFAGHA